MRALVFDQGGLTVRDDKHPDGDIEIEYTGLRPAEKLYEELLIGDNVMGTEHPMIMRAMEHSLPWEKIQSLLDELLVVMRKFDCRRAREMLIDAIAEYKPNAQVEDLVWRAHQAGNQVQPAFVIASEDGKVTELAARRAAKLPAP